MPMANKINTNSRYTRFYEYTKAAPTANDNERQMVSGSEYSGNF
jgi:hypothetical protein